VLPTAPPATLTPRDRYLRATRRLTVDRPPVWIMRQAGRYMPEYRALRERHSFDAFCNVPDLAVEVSMMPLTMLGVDALIIFNDILVPLNAMGCEVTFATGGPVIGQPVRHADDVRTGFAPVDFSAPGAEPIVCSSLGALRQAAGKDYPILGFAGAPFTMAAYAIEGHLSRDLDVIKRMRYEQPRLLHEILSRLTATVASYLEAQVKVGGCDAVQIFDTWAGQLSPPDFTEFAAPYQREVIARLKASCPGIPVTLFLRGGEASLDLIAESGADVLSLDWRYRLSEVHQRVGQRVALQGNVDPMALYGAESEVEGHLRTAVLGIDPCQGYIANLGHGILPKTRVSCAQAFVRAAWRLPEVNP